MSVFLIPIVAIIFGVGMAMLGVWTDHQRRSQLLEHQHRERMAAIEKGLPLPPSKAEVDSRDTRSPDPRRFLRSGVMLLSLGIVLFFAIGEAGGRQGALFGLLPAAIGLANLAYAVALFKKERDAAQKPDALPRE